MQKLGLITLVALVGVSCGKKSAVTKEEGASGSAPAPASGSGPAPAGAVSLTGAGSTFVYPIMSKWTAEYQKVHPDVTINYQSIGSGGGVKQFTARTVDFGASDVAMTDEEIAKLDGKVIHIPDTLGAVVIAYNLPDVTQQLKITPDILAGIYLGDIKTWDDKKIADANPGVKLPSDAISVAYRSDGSGTTAVFTSYLSAVNSTWKDKVGAGKSVAFPVGSGGKGNEGVSGLIKTTPGTIGYIELAYAKQTKQPYALMQNAAGKFVDATTETTSAAAAGFADKMPADYKISIVDAPGDTAYPIASFSYMLVYQDDADPAKGKALAEFLWWMVHDGQKFGPDLSYAPLPPALVTKIEATLRSLTAKGQPVLPAT